MKRGGKIIYSGELGQNSSKLIEYFEVSIHAHAMIDFQVHCLLCVSPGTLVLSILR